MPNLVQAHNEWRTRPIDQRFWNVQELAEATKKVRENSVTTEVPLQSLTVIPTSEDEISLQSNDGNNEVLSQVQARLNWFSANRLANEVKAPSAYLRTLPTVLAAKCLNHGIQQSERRNVNLLLHRNGVLTTRAITSDKYARIWNDTICGLLLPLVEQGWRNPPAYGDVRAATREDLMPCSRIRVGDMIGPSGLYASDKDMFAFLVNPTNPIEDRGSRGARNILYRGFITWNSEVGDKSYGCMGFLFNSVCGNHIIWDATEIFKTEARHVGHVGWKVRNNFEYNVPRFLEMSGNKMEERIKKSREYKLGNNKNEVLDVVFKKMGLLTLDEANSSYELAVANPQDSLDAAPYTAWGFVQGLTRMSQSVKFADKRAGLELVGGKILRLVNM
jgi:hypothetical protein